MGPYKAAWFKDADGNIIDEEASPDMREIEKWVRRIATHIVIVDDARHGGTGDFIGGEIRWYDSNNPPV